jgi:uncharacterized protein YndB with AHSA1/START domain
MATADSNATTFTTPSDRELVMTRVVNAPRSVVWEAWTTPEHVPHWLLGPEGWTMPSARSISARHATRPSRRG